MLVLLVGGISAAAAAESAGDAALAAPGTAPSTGPTAPAAPTPPDPEDAPTVSARADRVEARVGDIITVTVTAVARRGVAVNLPAHLELGKLTLLDKVEDDKPLDLGDGHLRREFRLKVAAYEPGELAIPPLEVTYLSQGGEVRSIATTPIDLKITSLLANVDQPELKDNAQPVRVYEQVVWPLYAGGALGGTLVLGTAAFFILRRWARRQVAAPAGPTRPAHELALARLDALRAEGLAERGEWKPLHLALSEIIRDYLGLRYGFDALEMTSTELLVALRARGVAGQEMVMIEAFVGACDLVKFAKHVPSFTEAQATLESAYRIVDATRVREAAVSLPHEARAHVA
jgi:hypothetical protein